MNGTQLRAMLWLRWRLTLNQWRRGGQLNAVITIILLIACLGLAVAGGVAGVLGGALGLSEASPQAHRATWDILVAVFLFLWTLGIISELQRSEMLDLSRLLYLPVSLRGVFLLNYLASHFSLSLALLLPAMLGLTVGLVFGSGPAMLLLVPLVLGFFYMITAWTYCLRGWLAALMVNKRRRRAIIVGVTMAVVLLFQLPNLLSNLWVREPYAPRPKSPEQIQRWLARRADEQQRIGTAIDVAHNCVPLLWLPQGAKALAEHRAWPALWGAAGMFALGTWGLARAYRATLRFYRGGESKKPARARPARSAAVASRRILVERTLPAVPEEAAATALASFRSLSRAPEVKMALATNILIFAFLGAGMLLRRTAALPAEAQPFVASAAVVLTFLGLLQVMFNHFGFDRSGFRTFVLLPTPRRCVLLGKNLALLPVALAVFAFNLGMVALLARLRIADILAAGLEFAAAFLVMSMLGNLGSILMPYRIAAGSLKPTKTTGMTRLLIVVTQMLLPLAMAPILLPAGLGLLGDLLPWLPAAVITLTCAVLLAAVAALLYWRTLEPLGRLLQRRERAILLVVTQEVE